MKKIRTFFIRTILGIMAGLFLSAGITATPVSVIRKQFECTTTN